MGGGLGGLEEIDVLFLLWKVVAFFLSRWREVFWMMGGRNVGGWMLCGQCWLWIFLATPLPNELSL